MKDEYSRYFPILKGIRELAENYNKYNLTTIREILTSWADRRPYEGPLDVIEEVFVGVRRLREMREAILRYLRDRDWRGAVVSVVGEYGSGKTQLGHILLRAIRKEGEAEPRLVSLDPISDVRDSLLESLDTGERPIVLIVDEVDQLLRDLERGRREKLEDLADIVRWITEGHYGSPARGSVVLLMSKRAREALVTDRALANRLLERAREFRLSMSDEEREKASVEAVKKVLALQMAYDKDSRSVITRNFPVIYRFLEKTARDLSLTREIGGVVKNLVDLVEEIVVNADEAVSSPTGVDLGNAVEKLVKEFLSKEMKSVQFRVRLGDDYSDYLAVFSPERLSVPGAVTDGQYVVWTYDSTSGRKGDMIVERVAVEVKFGTYWANHRDQILRVLAHHPLLLLSIAEMDPDERASLEAEIRRGGRAFGLLSMNPHIFRVALLLRGDYGLRFLRERGSFERDFGEVLSQIMTPSAVKQTIKGEVSGDKLLRAASSSILSSLLRELKAGRTSKRVTTLTSVIVASLDSVYSSAGTSPPLIPPHLIDKLLRVLVREGLGRLSKTGKSFMLSRESRLLIEELERDDERRRNVESVIYDVLSQSIEEKPLL